MKIKVEGILCDTYTDWGYPSDEAYVSSLYSQLEATRVVLEGFMDCIPRNGMGKENIELIKYVLNRDNFRTTKRRTK